MSSSDKPAKASEGNLLEVLLWECFEGPDGYTADRDLRATIHELPDASVVLAFRLDGKAFRRAAGLHLQGKKCCDGLLLVLQKPAQKSPRLAFFLVEMKGASITHGLEQLGDTLEAFRSYLDDGRVPRNVIGRAQFIPVVISDRASPEDLTTLLEAFEERHRVRFIVHLLSGGDTTADLSEALRRVWRSEPATKRETF